jgi:hypothetical protein
MHDLAEGLDRGCTHAQRGTVVAHEMREAGLDLAVSCTQRVIFGVGDFRRVLAVIELIVMGDFCGESLQL